MAITNPTCLTIESSATGVRRTGVWRFGWTAWLSGDTGNLYTVRIQIDDTDNTFGSLVYDSGAMETDDHRCGDGWFDVFPEDIPALASTTYWWRVIIVSDVPETGTATGISFTTEAAQVTPAMWGEAQA